MRDQINHRNRGQGPLLQVRSQPAGVSIAVGADFVRDAVCKKLLQVKSLPADVSIGVGAHRVRDQFGEINPDI